MVLSVYLSNYESGAYRSGTQVGHRQLSQCNNEIYCSKRQTKLDHQRQRDKLVGAEREFAEYVAAWNKEGIEEHLVQRGIRWKFNPPAASHFGGVWERLAISCKKTMYAVLGNRGRSLNNDVYC